MSDSTKYRSRTITYSNSIATQAPQKADKWTHANRKLVQNCSIERYDLSSPSYAFEELTENYCDPEIAYLLDDIGTMLTCGCDERPGVDMRSNRQNSRKTKRSEFFDRRLETIWESPIQRDIGTDSMPAVMLSVKETQVNTEMLRRSQIDIESEASAPVLPDSYGVVLTVRTVRNPNNFHLKECNYGPWGYPGPRAAFHRRPILAPTTGAHPDALSRLGRISRYITNPFNEINRGEQVITVDEFPVSRHRRRNTLRYNVRMVRSGNVFNVGGEIIERFVIDTEAMNNRLAHHTRVIPNPFQHVLRTRTGSDQLLVHTPSSNHTTPFWRRLGITPPVPRLWYEDPGYEARRHTIFPRDIQGIYRRTREERS